MKKDKSILITGGAGFLGSHIVDLFVRKNFKVTAIDNLSSTANSAYVNPKAEFIEMDINDKNLKSNKNGYIYALDGSKEIPTFLLNDQNSKIDYSELKDGLKIVGDFLNKTVLSPNNINFPTSRNEFTKLI